MTNEMKELYKQLDLNEKRNEFNELLIKMEVLLNALLAQNNISTDTIVRNYNSINDKFLTESETLSLFYEDLWNLKNKILLILTIANNK